MFNDVRNDPRLKRRKSVVVLQLIVIALFVLAIAYFLDRYSSDLGQLRQLSFRNTAIITMWSFVSYTAYAYSVYLLLRHLGLRNLSSWRWLQIYFASRIVNFVVTQGGNLFRLLVLKKKYGFSYTNTVGVTVFLVWINALIAIASATWFLIQLEVNVEFVGIDVVVWCLMMMCFLIGMPLFAFPVSKYRAIEDGRHVRFVRPVVDVAVFFVDSLRNGRLLVIITGLSIIHFGFFVGVNYSSFVAIDKTVELGIVCVFSAAFVITRYINIVPGNLGVSELIGGLMSELMGTGFSSGLIVTGIVRMIELVMIVLLGLLFGQSILAMRLVDRQDTNAR